MVDNNVAALDCCLVSLHWELVTSTLQGVQKILPESLKCTGFYTFSVVCNEDKNK